MDVAPTDIAPIDVAPADIAPMDVAASAGIAPVDVAPADIAPIDVAPAGIAPIDVANSPYGLCGRKTTLNLNLTCDRKHYCDIHARTCRALEL